MGEWAGLAHATPTMPTMLREPRDASQSAQELDLLGAPSESPCHRACRASSYADESELGSDACLAGRASCPSFSERLSVASAEHSPARPEHAPTALMERPDLISITGAMPAANDGSPCSPRPVAIGRL